MTAIALTSSGAPTPKDERYFKRLGTIVVAVVFGGILCWSVLAPIDGAIVTQGQVVVESNRKAVQHLEGGVVGEILVKEGEAVETGQVVARLENTVPKANVALIDGQLSELYARRIRLEAERDALADFGDPKGLEPVLLSDEFKKNLAGQKELFSARAKSRITQISLLEENITQQQERIGGFQAQIRALQNQTTLIRDELGGVRELFEQGFASKTTLRELEREEQRLKGERGALTAGIAEAESEIAEARIEIERLSEVGREEAITELRDVEVNIAEMEERRVTAADALRRTEIRAPQDGRVLSLAIHTVGGVIAPGAPLMEIVPRGDRLQIAARVAPQDIDKVRMGQETLVRFSAFGSRRTPETQGVVKQVSADSIVDPATGVPYYLVLVEIPEDSELLQVLGGATLVPGMPVEAFISTGSKSAISYLLKPLTDSFARSLREE